MAYFNLYFCKKLIRSFINFLFSFFKKHKKLLIFLLLFISYLLISNKCFAFTVDYNGVDYEIPDLPFDTETHNIYLFGYRASNNTFIVGYPVNTPVNNKVFCSPSDALDANIYRYYKTGTTYGEWHWYDISRTNLTSWSSQKTSSHGFLGFYTATIFSSVDIYESPTSSTIYFYENADDYLTPSVQYTQPSFISTVSELEDINNKNIKLDGGSFSDNAILRLYNHTNNSIIINSSLSNYDNYIEREDLSNPFSDLIYNIPYSAFNSFNLLKDNDYEWRIVYTNENNVLSNVSLFFTPSLNESINETTNKDLNDSIKDTNQKLDNIEDTLNDSNVDSDIATNLPSVNVQNPTESGLDTLFTNIYNAFCTGTAQDIVFPVPFTNKNITLSPSYVRNSLLNSNSSWVITLIETFWAFLFGSYIVRDISKKIRKNQVRKYRTFTGF